MSEAPAFHFTKYQVDAYHFRNGWDWATFFIAPSGQVTIHSSYGVWGHWWSSIGPSSIEEFLPQCHTDYLIGKFGGAEKHFNFRKSIENCRDALTDLYSNADISEKRLKEAIEDIDALESEGFDDATTFSYELAKCRLLGAVAHNYEAIVLEPDPSLVRFMEIFWPLLLRQFKEGRQ